MVLAALVGWGGSKNVLKRCFKAFVFCKNRLKTFFNVIERFLSCRGFVPSFIPHSLQFDDVPWAFGHGLSAQYKCAHWCTAFRLSSAPTQRKAKVRDKDNATAGPRPIGSYAKGKAIVKPKPKPNPNPSQCQAKATDTATAAAKPKPKTELSPIESQNRRGGRSQSHYRKPSRARPKACQRRDKAEARAEGRTKRSQSSANANPQQS